MRFEAALSTAQGGTIKGNGTIAQDLKTADAQVEATGVPLTPLQPLIAHYAALDLKSGHASASARVNYQGGGKGPSLSATGTMSMGDVLVNETETGDRFLSWKTLSADEVTFTLAPNRLAIKEIRVLEPGAKVVISKNGEVNLAQVLRRCPPGQWSRGVESQGASRTRSIKPSPESPPATPLPRTSAGSASGTGRSIIADLSLALPFSARVRRFNGSAVGISTDRASRAELKFDGRIEGSGVGEGRRRPERVRSQSVHRHSRRVRQRRDAAAVALRRDLRRTQDRFGTALARPALQDRQERARRREQDRDAGLHARRARGGAERARSAARSRRHASHRQPGQDQRGGAGHGAMSTTRSSATGISSARRSRA